MSFWWVNHKQTFSSEIDGGYIWSPKGDTNGAKNQTYLNLTLTKPGDIIFSYADTKIKAIGIVSANYREQPKPSEFGKSGNAWANTGWAVPITREILSTPIIPKLYLDTPLLPAKTSPLQSKRNANHGCYWCLDALRYQKLQMSGNSTYQTILTPSLVSNLNAQLMLRFVTRCRV